MTDSPVTIAGLIVADIQGANPFAPYATTPPRGLTDAYMLQDRVLALLGGDAPGAIGGWKIAANSAALMGRFGLDEPLSGRVLASQRQDNPARLRADAYRQFAFEPEIAAVMGRSLAPASAPFTRDQVAAAIDRFVPAMELLDMREADMAGMHIPDAVAQNISNVGAVLGGPGMAPGALDPGAVRTQLIIDGETRHDVTGAAPQHPLDAVTWLANHLVARGLMLEAGQLVLCGTHSPIWYHDGPGEIEVRMAGLGAVSLRLE
ncbi:MAG: fumarylacetoacetate hydrolase family protein [Pararhodobacter sp.]|nr:fumarylacetoacetate hydrolase family protein [Pararhodobacter sp.]